MSIPYTARSPSPPPPLPPPRNIEELGLTHGPSPVWSWPANPNWTGFGKSHGVRSGSSLLAGTQSTEESTEDSTNPGDTARRGSSISTVTAVQRTSSSGSETMRERTGTDDGLGRIHRPSSEKRLHSERQLEQRALEDSSQAYDRNLLSRIGGPSTPGRPSLRASTSSNTSDSTIASSGMADSRHGSLNVLSVLDRRQQQHQPVEGPASGWANMVPAPGGAISPGSSFRSPTSEPELTRPLTRRNPSLTIDDSSVSHGGSYDSTSFAHDEFAAEQGQMRDLNINDRSPASAAATAEELRLLARAGMKRRASSPHREVSREERSSVGSAVAANDLYHRRSMQQLPQRGSPISRYQPQHHGSVSSTSSYRNGSLSSSHGMSISSSITSLASGRFSPRALSPAIDPDLSLSAPYAITKSSHSSPRGSLSSIGHQQQSQQQHQRVLLDTSPIVRVGSPEQIISHSRQGSSIGVQGMFICDCCPKKPKKFGTEEELIAHHQEKQYTCAYCPNRFKNKNEAERHQNSLHLRHHSWACAALTSIESTFHQTQTNGGLTDTCGFCGDEFVNPPQWDKRRDHVSIQHKFGECNQAKKFFRADHFRQHLKHSHAGTSGKWTNMLENACVKDEPQPQPMQQQHRSQPGSAAQSAAGLTQGLTPLAPVGGVQSTMTAGVKPVVIDEVIHEG